MRTSCLQNTTATPHANTVRTWRLLVLHLRRNPHFRQNDINDTWPNRNYSTGKENGLCKQNITDNLPNTNRFHYKVFSSQFRYPRIWTLLKTQKIVPALDYVHLFMLHHDHVEMSACLNKNTVFRKIASRLLRHSRNFTLAPGKRSHIARTSWTPHQA